MSFTDLFCLFTVVAMALTYRPGASASTWEYVLLGASIITAAILVCRIGGVSIPSFKKGQ